MAKVVVARLKRSTDFERVLASAPRSRSTHFAAHHLPVEPSRARKTAAMAVVSADPAKLSTGDAPSCPPPVDDLAVETAPRCWWLGLVVPKRHARRAVTRTLLKRQMRAVMADRASALDLPYGLWVLRLKSPFDRERFRSAASDALRGRARAELITLLDRAAPRR